ncbi:MAG: hypothetical protein KJ576_20980 [Proteobacteria bacterium]|nr:hypothetical protein [Pseudomonadota bacterium]
MRLDGNMIICDPNDPRDAEWLAQLVDHANQQRGIHSAINSLAKALGDSEAAMTDMVAVAAEALGTQLTNGFYVRDRLNVVELADDGDGMTAVTIQ